MELERKVIVVTCIVGLLGLLSAATAFAAEAKRIKTDQVKVVSATECSYPSSPALGLGLTAAISLLIAQIIICVASGCVCCRRGPHQSNADWSLAIICFIVSWFAFAIAFILLLSGAALNSKHTEEDLSFGYYYCYVVKPGMFGGAALLSLSSVILGIIYYLTLSTAKNRNNLGGAPVPQGGIAMGQAQVPPQDPVFVHEDTYMRRQVAL